MICPKLTLQKAWLSNVGWDTALDEKLSAEYQTWLKDLPSFKELKVPRALEWTDEIDASSLHTFRLLAAKVRVAPLNGSTIPRLELLATTIGARLASSVIEALKLNNLDILLVGFNDRTRTDTKGRSVVHICLEKSSKDSVA